MRAHILILSFIFLVASRAQGQTYFTSTEVGLAFGATQYFGDLNDNYGFKTITPTFGLYGRKHLSQYISLKLTGMYAHLSYSDKYNKNAYQRQRNLDFSTDIYEITLQSEFNFFRFVTGDPYHRFTPFLTGGVGAFYYNPYTTINGDKVFLRGQGTEGQNTAAFKDRRYGTVAACFPIGAGVKFWLKGGINISLEVTDRLTFTDYIDDVSATYVGLDKFPTTGTAALLQDRSVEVNGSTRLGREGKQRGNTSSFDQYLMAQITLSWHFKTYHCPAALSDDMIQTY